MKRTIMIAAAFVLVASTAMGDEYVNGYSRKDGTYVPSHYRSDRNDTTLDNWSTKGNTNPYTGLSGGTNPSGNSFGVQSQRGYGNRYGR